MIPTYSASRRSLWCIVVSVLMLPSSLAVGAGAQPIVGTWRWTYSVEGGRRNADPRWTLLLTFKNDGSCTCASTLVSEVQIQDSRTGGRSTMPMTEQHELHGTYTMDGTTMTLDFGPSEINLMKSCGFWQFGVENASVVRVQVNATASELVMRGGDGRSESHFERQREVSTSPAAN